MEKNKQPKKPKKPATKQENTIPATTPTPLVTDIPSLTLEENQEFLKHINRFLEKKDTAKKENITDFNALSFAIGEFLESFIAFGYTYDGRRVLIQQSITPRDKDAMLEFLKNVFVANASKDSIFDSDENE